MSEQTDMLLRIRHADIYDLSFAYCRFTGLPWLSWPLGRMPYRHDQHLRDVVAAVVRAPICQRTEAQCWAELRRIDNVGLQRVLNMMEIPAPPRTTEEDG